MAGGEILPQAGAFESVFGAEEHRGMALFGQDSVQAVQHVVEVAPLGMDIESGAQDDANLTQHGASRQTFKLHAAGLVTTAHSVIPNALIGLGIDALLPSVQYQGDKRLGNPEVFCKLGLRDAARHVEALCRHRRARFNLGFRRLPRPWRRLWVE